MELTHSRADLQQNAMSALANMFYDPVRAFKILEARTYAWLPLFLLMSTTAALTAWYFSIVDFSWFQDQVLATISDVEAREQARHVMTERMMIVSTLAAAVVTPPIVWAILGVYFIIAGKFINRDISFVGAFALSAWSSVNSLLLLPLGAIQIYLSSNGKLGFSELNPVSINQLFFNFEMAHPMANVLDSLSLMTLWSIVLSVLGFQVWTKVSRATALKVVVGPYAVFYGVWLAYAASQYA